MRNNDTPIAYADAYGGVQWAHEDYEPTVQVVPGGNGWPVGARWRVILL